MVLFVPRADLQEKARVIVVPIGTNIDMDAVTKWASWPAEENVLAVDDFAGLRVKLGEMLSAQEPGSLNEASEQDFGTTCESSYIRKCTTDL